MSRDDMCRHFTGIQQRTCKAGENYMEHRILPERGGMAMWPCTDPSQRHTCSKFEPWTAAELAEQKREFRRWLDEVTAFEQRKTENCPQCARHVERLEQVDRCVYAHPCGCRVWQGRVPEVWKDPA